MRNPWKISTLVLAVALGLVVGNNVINTADADPQPRMKAALGHLEKALGELKAATADKGGHRAKAIDLTNQAIAETQKGISFDNKH
jgi:hypothetical protein